jgi:hypothetical protein
MAAKKGVNRRVRQIGTLISTEHKQLDAIVLRAARQVGVELPNEPNADQQQWLAEMAAASGAEFDQVFIDRLRAAHGKVFPVIGQVRAGTRNTVVRQLAQSANVFVLGHLTYLESTGLVEYSALPAPPQPTQASAAGARTPTTATTATTARSVSGLFGKSPSLSGLILPVAVLIAVPYLLRWMVRRRMALRQADYYGPPPPYDRYESRQTRGYPPDPYTAERPSRRLQSSSRPRD